MKCPDCNGKGSIALFTTVEQCTRCGGTGELCPAVEAAAAEIKVISRITYVPLTYSSPFMMCPVEMSLQDVDFAALEEFIRRCFERCFAQQLFIAGEIRGRVEREYQLPSDRSILHPILPGAGKHWKDFC